MKKLWEPKRTIAKGPIFFIKKKRDQLGAMWQLINKNGIVLTRKKYKSPYPQTIQSSLFV
jgi:hypothetical protein